MNEGAAAILTTQDARSPALAIASSRPTLLGEDNMKASELEVENERLRKALRLCLEYFDREISDDITMVDSDFGNAYRACIEILRPYL